MYEATGLSNIQRVVKNIRQQRAFSVETPEQYLFCHLTLIQYAILMGKLEAAADISTLLSVG